MSGSIEDIRALAEKLGEAIARNPRFLALREAEKAIEADAEAKSLLKALNEKTLEILRKEESLKPVEPEEKRELSNLRSSVARNENLQKLQKAQADYSEMMNRVNRSLFDNSALAKHINTLSQVCNHGQIMRNENHRELPGLPDFLQLFQQHVL